MRTAGAREDGFTIIEMLVAAVIVTVGALTAFGLLSAATKNTQRGKETQVALDKAQQELEALRGLPNKDLAMTELPPHLANQLEPSYRVNGENFAVNRQPVAEYQPMVVNGDKLDTGGVVEGGIIKPGPVSFSSGDVSGKVWRYVVWRNDERCGSACPRSQDFKQVIVAVKLDTPGNLPAERGYVEVQSDFIDPTDSAKNDPPPNNGNQVIGQQFYLSDTPCAKSGTTTRQAITEDHLLHNTLGTCADGLQNGGTQGAPDALLLSAPPDPTPEDPSDPPLYNYSDDFYLEPQQPNEETDKGVKIRPDDSAGCNYTPTAVTHPEAKIHRWVTDPMPAEFSMTGTATLQFYSRTLNNALMTGAVCVFVFKRHEEETASGVKATDTLLEHTSNGVKYNYWMYVPENSSGYWPRDAWATLRLKMEFDGAPVTIGPKERLGVALSVEKARTQVGQESTAIPIMYDHPLYATRLEVDTTTPLEGG